MISLILFDKCFILGSLVLKVKWLPLLVFIIYIYIWNQVNELVKRARAAKIHAYIISHLKKEMPALMGKAKTQQKLISNLEDIFAKVSISSFSWPLCSHLRFWMFIYLEFRGTGSERISFTGRRFSKCGEFQGGFDSI